MEQFYRVVCVDYSDYEAYTEFDEQEDAIKYAEGQWEEGEGGNALVTVQEITIEDDYSEESINEIWKRSIEDDPVDLYSSESYVSSEDLDPKNIF